MKRKIIFTMLCIAAVATVSGYVGLKTYQSNANGGVSNLMITDVEALADPELGKPIEIHYSNMHFKCYDYIPYAGTYIPVENGLYSATSYVDTLSHKDLHSHECSSCRSY